MSKEALEVLGVKIEKGEKPKRDYKKLLQQLYKRKGLDENGNPIDEDELELDKAEGSKGGQVIGHTKSGKPVYARKPGHHEVYKQFTKEDHEDARELHDTQKQVYHKQIPEEAFRTSGMRGYAKNPIMSKRDFHDQRRVEHDMAAWKMRDMSKSAIDELNKSRKGDPIGTTKTWAQKKYIKTAGGWKPHSESTEKETKSHIEKNPSLNHKDEELQTHAKQTPQGELERIVKESTDPRLRQHAHVELSRRKKEEGKMTKKELPKGVEYLGPDIDGGHIMKTKDGVHKHTKGEVKSIFGIHHKDLEVKEHKGEDMNGTENFKNMKGKLIHSQDDNHIVQYPGGTVQEFNTSEMKEVFNHDVIVK